LRSAAVFEALGNEHRRWIVERLAAGPVPVGVIAAGLPVSRPAVSKHLRILEEAGLVGYEASGTRRVYHLEPAGFDAARQWLDHFWGLALHELAALSEEGEGRRG
jgi:DNA-binding transcriptional ArsR family regulator